MTCTGLVRVSGRLDFVELVRLGASMVVVMTSGLKGTTPVFLNAEMMFSLLSASICAFAYTDKKFVLDTFAPLRSKLSWNLVQDRFKTLKITTSSP